jgi:hypothetical protein
MRPFDIETLVAGLHAYCNDNRPESSLQSVMLHGSRVNCSVDEHSDLDLVLLVNQGRSAYDAISVGGFKCDLFITCIDEAYRLCERDVLTNNHFVLRALATGNILVDAKGQLHSLQTIAIDRWHRGPRLPSLQEVRQIRFSAMKIRFFFEKCLLRGRTEARWMSIGEARTGYFLSQLVDCYCRLKVVWSNSFWLLRAENDNRYHEIERFIEGYLLEPNTSTKCIMVSELASLVIELSDNKLATYYARKDIAFKISASATLI